MNRLRQRICFPAALTVAMLVADASARVFLSGEAAPLAEVSEAIGLKQVYRTEYKINGSDAVLEIYGGDLPAGVAANRLESGLRARQLNAAISGGDDGAMGILTTRDELTRMVVSPAGPGKAMVFAVRQRWEDVARFNATTAAGQAPDALLPNIPPFPGGRLVYHMEDQKTKTTIVVYRAGGTPETACQFYAQSLPSNGWEPMGGRAGGRSAPVMFRRGTLNCTVSAQTDGKTGEVTVTLLIRRSSL
ncbi:MAG: hypothetical protein WC740_05690 [Verrucomicrobiia bacterium]